MSEEQGEEGRKLKLVAGVFLDPETGQAEIHAGEEGIEPVTVMANAVIENMRMAIATMNQLQTIQGRPKVLRAGGPLPVRKP